MGSIDRLIQALFGSLGARLYKTYNLFHGRPKLLDRDYLKIGDLPMNKLAWRGFQERVPLHRQRKRFKTSTLNANSQGCLNHDLLMLVANVVDYDKAGNHMG